ncbi:MAG: hypothetical protein E6J00_05440, partial [Chloroflexi bacterium]
MPIVRGPRARSGGGGQGGGAGSPGGSPAAAGGVSLAAGGVTRDLEALRARIQAIAARPSLRPMSGPGPRGSQGSSAGLRLPRGCVLEETPFGPVAVRRRSAYPSMGEGGLGVSRSSSPSPLTGEGGVGVSRSLEAISRCMAISVEALARPLYLDTETTGLSGGTGTVPFMVGLAWPQDGDLEVAQYFLCDLDQERALLWAVGQRLDRCGVLVTYNGRSFDWPLLQTRLVMA